MLVITHVSPEHKPWTLSDLPASGVFLKYHSCFWSQHSITRSHNSSFMEAVAMETISIITWMWCKPRSIPRMHWDHSDWIHHSGIGCGFHCRLGIVKRWRRVGQISLVLWKSCIVFPGIPCRRLRSSCILLPKWHRRNNSLHSTLQVPIIIWLNWHWAILKVWKVLRTWWFPWWCNVLYLVRFCWPTTLCAGNWIGPVIFWPVSASFSFSQPLKNIFPGIIGWHRWNSKVVLETFYERLRAQISFLSSHQVNYSTNLILHNTM